MSVKWVCDCCGREAPGKQNYIKEIWSKPDDWILCYYYIKDEIEYKDACSSLCSGEISPNCS